LSSLGVLRLSPYLRNYNPSVDHRFKTWKLGKPD
jgi:hypothetical protein